MFSNSLQAKKKMSQRVIHSDLLLLRLTAKSISHPLVWLMRSCWKDVDRLDWWDSEQQSERASKRKIVGRGSCFHADQKRNPKFRWSKWVKECGKTWKTGSAGVSTVSNMSRLPCLCWVPRTASLIQSSRTAQTWGKSIQPKFPK